MQAVPNRATTPALDPPAAWLERANRHALTARLVAAAVHDVSNALQVVAGAAEMLGLDASPEAVAKRSASIVQQAMAATATLQQLSAFARDATGPAAGAVVVRDVCARALLMRQYTLRKLRIAAGVDGDAGACPAPSRELLQVVLNLVVNAEQALADRPDARLTLRVDTGPAEVTLVVADNGPGMSPDARDAAFRWPPVGSADPSRLGIGLLVSRALVERSGGTLRIEAAAGGGTAVVVGLRR